MKGAVIGLQRYTVSYSGPGPLQSLLAWLSTFRKAA